jgi:hypothetical protein
VCVSDREGEREKEREKERTVNRTALLSAAAVQYSTATCSRAVSADRLAGLLGREKLDQMHCVRCEPVAVQYRALVIG